MIVHRITLSIGLLMLATPAIAQWHGYPTPNVPRTPDGKPDLAAAAPRTPEGLPDLSGIWVPTATPKYLRNLAADLDGGAPLQPWAAALYAERRSNDSRDVPTATCNFGGVPHMDAVPAPYKILQTPGLVVFLHEALNMWRQIFTDGRDLPQNPIPTWMGYSIGRWDNDTLVVTTTGFNGKVWLDLGGLPSTKALKVTERFRRRDFGHMDLQIMIDDAEAYTRPWTVSYELGLLVDTELLEMNCNENNQYLTEQ